MSKRKDSPGADGKVAVRLPTRVGALRVGPYLAGQVYRLEPDEAERLVRVKGFEVVGDESGDR